MLYGDYTSNVCRRQRDICAGSPTRRDRKVVYIYRQYTEAGNADAVSAARGALSAGQQDQFWVMHQLLFRRGQKFAADDIDQLAQEIDLDIVQFEQDVAMARVKMHLAEDRELAEQVGIICTPALFTEGNPYSGAWDELSIMDAVEQPFGFWEERASQRFFGWAASGGLLLILATLAALIVANSGFHDIYEKLRLTVFTLEFGDARFGSPVEAWINDCLVTVFLLIVGMAILVFAGKLPNLEA